MAEPSSQFTDAALIDFCTKLDARMDIDLSEWESGFIANMIKYKRVQSDKQRMALDRMIDKYAKKFSWNPPTEAPPAKEAQAQEPTRTGSPGQPTQSYLNDIEDLT